MCVNVHSKTDEEGRKTDGIKGLEYMAGSGGSKPGGNRKKGRCVGKKSEEE